MALSKIPANMVSILESNEVTESASDPTVSTNPAGGLGTLWLNTTSGEMYCCTDATVGANIWTNIGAGTGDFAPYTGLVATGGTITTDGDYKVHTFNESGTFTVTNPGTDAEVEYLVIAGGGGGSRRSTAGGDGGGGAGGYRTATGFSVSAQAYTVTVGAGGAGQTSANGSAGSNSEFGAIASTGGGGGAWDSSSATNLATGGGSAGGGGWGSHYFGHPMGSGNAGGYDPVEGYDGGLGGYWDGPHGISGGGGGGAGGVGQPGHRTSGIITGGDGGVGRSSSITGTAVMRAGGGGGGGDSRTSGPGGAGGDGGGGTGGGTGTTPTSGTVNTGGGGGAVGSGTSGSVMNGGSGTVIIRYKFQQSLII